jgi:UDP-glucuronate 4-epimerase
MKVFITGVAGFIGFHLCKVLAENGNDIVAIDSINDYYDINLKYARLAELGILNQQDASTYNTEIASDKFQKLIFIKLDITDETNLEAVFTKHKFDIVLHLAAQAGVRYSITNPKVYIQSNMVGFANLLECCKTNGIRHFIYASSSSVYGMNEKTPFAVTDNVDHPISLYAATKKSNELMAHVYSSLYKLPTTGLRFFTVYGPWGRPDMALFKFTESIFKHKPIEIYNNGEMTRDFTYVDDIIQGVLCIINEKKLIAGEQVTAEASHVPYRIYNIGNGKPVKLIAFIEALEKTIGIPAVRKYLPMQKGDVLTTFADISELKKLGYEPKTAVNEGIGKFVNWYKTYYKM